MNVFEQNKDFYNNPIRLSPDQLQDPLKVLREFFIDFHLYESRALLADWLQTALTTPNSQFAEAAERNAIAVFAEKLEELLEAVSIIIQPAKK